MEITEDMLDFFGDDGAPGKFEKRRCRDDFAMHALHGLLAGGELRAASGASAFNGHSPMQAIAEKAYQLADAMLAARDK